MLKKLSNLILSFSICLAAIHNSFSATSTYAVSEEAIIEDYMRPKSLEDALCYYIWQDDFQLVKKVVEMGADINKNDYYGDLPLYAAVLRCDHVSKDIVDFLLFKGANPYLTHQKGISVMDLFTMADRSYFKDTFEKYGYTVPEYYNTEDSQFHS